MPINRRGREKKKAEAMNGAGGKKASTPSVRVLYQFASTVTVPCCIVLVLLLTR